MITENASGVDDEVERPTAIFKLVFVCSIVFSICCVRSDLKSFEPLRKHWTVKVAEDVDAGRSRTFVSGGVLELGYYAFQRSDKLTLSGVDYAVVEPLRITVL